jgi:transcriptional regulator with XRE-family HTH domain
MRDNIQMSQQVGDHVGERIRIRRTELGLTQEDLAQQLAISYQQVQKYETGTNRISAGRLYEIAITLKTDISYFFEGFDPVRIAEDMAHGGHYRSAIELVRSFREIKDENLRSAVTNLMKALKEHQARD